MSASHRSRAFPSLLDLSGAHSETDLHPNKGTRDTSRETTGIHSGSQPDGGQTMPPGDPGAGPQTQRVRKGAGPAQGAQLAGGISRRRARMHWPHTPQPAVFPEMPPCPMLLIWFPGGQGAGVPPPRRTKATAKHAAPSSPVCVRTCLFRSKVSLKPLPQKVHRCLFTWLWHLRCRLSMRCRRKALPHSSQLWAAGSLHVPVVNWDRETGRVRAPVLVGAPRGLSLGAHLPVCLQAWPDRGSRPLQLPSGFGKEITGSSPQHSFFPPSSEQNSEFWAQGPPADRLPLPA